MDGPLHKTVFESALDNTESENLATTQEEHKNNSATTQEEHKENLATIQEEQKTSSTLNQVSTTSSSKFLNLEADEIPLEKAKYLEFILKGVVKKFWVGPWTFHRFFCKCFLQFF